MVLALSVSSEIKTVGSYAGLAALLGLAILALLYFAQARETRRLGEWIEREEQRRASVAVPAPVQMQVPLARASVPAPGPPPPLAGAAITTAVPGVRRVAVPPAAVAADAGAVVGSATSVVATAPEAAAPPRAPEETTRIAAIPIAAPATPAAAGLAAPAAQEVTEAAPSETAPVAQAPTHAPTPSPADALPGHGSPAGQRTPASDPPALERPVLDSGPDTGEMDAVDLPSAAAVPLVAEPSPSVEPRRVTWPPLAAEEDPRAQAAPEEPEIADAPAEVSPVADAPAEVSPFGPSTAAGARPRFPPPPSAGGGALVDAETTVRSAGAAAFGAPAAVAAPVSEPTRRREREVAAPADEGGDRRSMASTLKLLLAAIVIVVALILVAEHVFGGSGKSTPPSSAQRTNSATNGSGAPAPSTITVSVLNGTHRLHLASTAWAVLGKLGFRQSAIADAPVQNHRITFIAFTGANRPAALEVARDLNVATIHVHDTIDPATLAAATATGHAPPAVMVILGANYRSG